MCPYPFRRSDVRRRRGRARHKACPRRNPSGPGRELERRAADDRDRRRRQSRARLEEHDAGDAPARGAAAGRQGGDPRRGDQARARACAPRLRGRDRGRPGPVVIDVPEDIAHGEHDFDAADFWVDPATTRRRRAARAPMPPISSARRPAGAAQRPLILAGGGMHISEAYDALRPWPKGKAFPWRTRMSGKGAIACTHPLSAGLFGRYDRIANAMIAEIRLPARRRLQARRDRDQALRAVPPGQAHHPHRDRSDRDRPHHAHGGGARRRRAAGAGRPRSGTRRRPCRGSRRAPSWYCRGAGAHGGMARGARGAAGVERDADQCRPADGAS